MESLRLLALSGSLRKESYNSAVLSALRSIAPENITISIGDISGLPLFNHDREDELIPALVELKGNLKSADGLIIASPEYAHGISGPMKNALDWLVSGDEFPYKPVMLINTSPRAHHALDALREVLVTMSASIIDTSCVTIPLLGSHLDAEGIIKNHDLVEILSNGLNRFCHEVRNMSKPAYPRT